MNSFDIKIHRFNAKQKKSVNVFTVAIRIFSKLLHY